MAQVKILFSWSQMGQNGVDATIASQVPPGVVKMLDAYALKEIIDEFNETNAYFIEKGKMNKFDKKLVDKNKVYYIYYNYHPNSGYRSEIGLNEDGTFDIKVTHPHGFSLQAFWSEVIIFEIVE